MRFSTDDGTFALIVSPAQGDHGPEFFRFQLTIDDETVGDEEPGILGSAMHFLRQVQTIDDPLLAHLVADVDHAHTTAMTDQTAELHDRICFTHAESLDRWNIIAYQHAETVTWIARSADNASERTKIATLPVSDYAELVEQVTTYWNRERGA